MRPNRNHLAIILKSSKALLTAGGLVTLVSVDRAVAQDQGSSQANAPTTDTSSNEANPTDPNAPAAAPVEALPPPADAGEASRAVVPPVYQSPANPTPTNIPQYQTQLGNPISPFTSSSTNPQSPQLTQPGLYLTGNRDVSQVSTSNALASAFSNNAVDLSSGDAGMNYEHPPIERIKLGPFDLKAALVSNATYDDNVRTNGTNGDGKKGDLEYGTTPAILLVFGLHDGQKGFASLVYAPTISRYYHQTDQNNIGQNVAFNAVYPFQKLTLNLTQSFTQTTGVNQDSNVRTTQESINSGFGATYEVDDKISVSATAQNTVTSFSNPGDSNNNGGGNTQAGNGDTTTSINMNANYRLSEKLTLGPGINVGWDRPDSQQKSTYEQGLAALNYAPTEKIGMYAQAGVELRQYDQGGGNTTNPIFSLGVGYNPFDSTSLNITASQSQHASTAQIGQPTSGQTVLSTAVGATITQRIVQRVFVSFAFNYSHDDDQNGGGNNAGGIAGSQDNYTYSPSVTFAPTAWSNISVYYQYLSNESNIPGQSYNDNQMGLSVSAQF
jgi:hypothetical protein